MTFNVHTLLPNWAKYHVKMLGLTNLSNSPNSLAAGAKPQTPLGELTTLSQNR
jgi:hypothetical protein